MINKLESKIHKNFAYKLFFTILVGTALYSHYWLDVITDHSFGADFRIYWQATLKAIDSTNPYFPYEIGESFIYHPFILSVLSLFSLFNNYSLILIIWSFANVIAYAVAIYGSHSIYIHYFPKENRFISKSKLNIGFLLFIIFLSFVPFWETIFIGQINGFVLLCIVFSLLNHLNERPWISGVWLAIAILLKISPIFLLGYFFVRFRWKEIGSVFISLFIATLIPGFQFGFKIIANFTNILPLLNKEIHPSFYNQSLLATAQRFLSYIEISRFKFINFTLNSDVLILFHKIILIVLIGVILGYVFYLSINKKSVSPWWFLSIWVIIILFSPLVWMHHGIFFVLPLVFMLNHNKLSFNLALLGILMIQISRLIENYIFIKIYPAGIISISGFIILYCCLNFAIKDIKINPEYQNKS